MLLVGVKSSDQGFLSEVICEVEIASGMGVARVEIGCPTVEQHEVSAG